MHPPLLAVFFAIPNVAVAMCSAGIALFLVGAFAAKNDVARAHGLDKIVALTNLCFAIPLAVFGALHLFAPQFVLPIVPRYMSGPMLWAYFVGCALIAASLSIAAKIQVRWSGLLFGIMMFSFVAMIHFPGALREPHNRIIWMVVFREMSFGGAGWLLAASAKDGWDGSVKTSLITVGRILVAITAIVFGVTHIILTARTIASPNLNQLVLPAVPLIKLIPTWIPLGVRVLIEVVTGVALIVAGASILLNRKTRTVATCVGSWILLLVLVIYGPVLIAALSDSAIPIKVEGINYFADTLLFAATILAVASASPRSNSPAI